MSTDARPQSWEDLTPTQRATVMDFAAQYVDEADIIQIAEGVGLLPCKRCGASIMVRASDPFASPTAPLALHIRDHFLDGFGL